LTFADLINRRIYSFARRSITYHFYSTLIINKAILFELISVLVKVIRYQEWDELHHLLTRTKHRASKDSQTKEKKNRTKKWTKCVIDSAP